MLLQSDHRLRIYTFNEQLMALSMVSKLKSFDLYFRTYGTKCEDDQNLGHLSLHTCKIKSQGNNASSLTCARVHKGAIV